MAYYKPCLSRDSKDLVKLAWVCDLSYVWVASNCSLFVSVGCEVSDFICLRAIESVSGSRILLDAKS